MKAKAIIAYEDVVLYQGDCIPIMKQLSENSVDLIISSPPYETQRTYREDNFVFELSGQAWVDWMVSVFVESLRVCKGLVAFVVGSGVTRHFKWSATPALLMADLHRKGITLRSPKFYHRYGMPGSGGPDGLRKDTEFIVCATSGGKLSWSDVLACGKPFKFKQGGAMSHRNKEGERIRRLHAKKFKSNKANPGDVIDCGAVGGGNIGSKIAHENEAPFPEKIPNFFIRTFCPPNGTVLDPFAGSGTTLAEAIKTGRKAIGIDIRKSQIKLCKRRVHQASVQPNKLGLVK